MSKIKNMKRFQECNWLVKLWRYRFYMLLPFLWVWEVYLKPNKQPINMWHYKETRGKFIWRMLLGETQLKMGWWYTSEEVFDSINERFNL